MREVSMRSPNPQVDIHEIWASNLSQIRTAYGRLVYLAGLRNANTGRYEHYGSDGQARTNMDRALKTIHERLFRDWVGFPLKRKQSDIEEYISGIEHEVDRTELIDAWLRLTPYKNLVPASIQGPERQKHISDFEAILGLLRNVYGVASPDRDA